MTPHEQTWESFGKQKPLLPYVAHIYILIDPRTDEIRYVGKSSKPLSRLNMHLNESARGSHKSRWIQELKTAGLKPIMEIVESIASCDESLWKFHEIWWIARLKAMGARLVNSTIGGDGVTGLPLETRQRMAATWKGRKHRPESLLKIGAASKGRLQSEEVKRKKRLTLQAIPHGEDWNSKVAEAIRKFSPEQSSLIKQRLDAGEKTGELAREYGVHRTTMSKIKMGTYFDRYRPRDGSPK